MTTPYQAFPPALMILSPRLTKAGDPASSVVGLNTTPLADGAIAYCLETQFPYRLDKQSSAAPDGTLVLAPLTGPGRWLADAPPTPAVTRLAGIAFATPFNAGNNFADPGSTGLYVTCSNLTGPHWAFTGTGFTLTDATACILTYTGPSGRRFLATLTASASVPPGEGGTALCGFVVAHNNDLLGSIFGDTPGTDAGGAFVNLPFTNDQLQMDSQRIVTLSTGDTLRPVGGMSSALIWSVLSCTFSVVQIDP